MASTSSAPRFSRPTRSRSEDRPEQTMTGTELRRRMVVSTSAVPPPRSKSRMTRSAGWAKTASSDSSTLAASVTCVAGALQVVLEGAAGVVVVLGHEDRLVGHDVAHGGEHRGRIGAGATEALADTARPVPRRPAERSCGTAQCRGRTPPWRPAVCPRRRASACGEPTMSIAPLVLPAPVRNGSSCARTKPDPLSTALVPSCVLSVGRRRSRLHRTFGPEIGRP